jgi:hypothetical protein
VQLSNCLLVEGEEGLLSCWMLTELQLLNGLLVVEIEDFLSCWLLEEVELQLLNCLLVVGQDR